MAMKCLTYRSLVISTRLETRSDGCSRFRSVMRTRSSCLKLWGCSSWEKRASSWPSRPTREVFAGRFTSASTWTVLVSVVAASFRYEDGKTLKGMGTRASKSRLSGVAAWLLEDLSNRYRNNSRGRQEETSWLRGLLNRRSWRKKAKQICLRQLLMREVEKGGFEFQLTSKCRAVQHSRSKTKGWRFGGKSLML